MRDRQKINLLIIMTFSR